MLSSAYEFDESQWPHLRLVMIRKPSDDEFSAYLDEYETYLTRSDRYGVLYDVDPSVGMISVAQARMQANWMKHNASRLRLRCFGVAFVLPSAVHRGVLKAIFKMQPIPTDYRVVRTLDEAHLWLSDQSQRPEVA